MTVSTETRVLPKKRLDPVLAARFLQAVLDWDDEQESAVGMFAETGGLHVGGLVRSGRVAAGGGAARGRRNRRSAIKAE